MSASETTTPHFATRLNSFRRGGGANRTVREALAAAAAVEGLSAVELNFPQHFEDDGPADADAARTVIAAARDLGLAVTALNLRWDGPDFLAGAFTHPVAANREKAVARAQAAVDAAAAADVDHVILWMGPDGFDYPFQADYRQLWDWEIDGFRRVAERDPSVRVSVEYKPSDPRRLSLIRNMGDALYAVRGVDRANFGATLDLCHVLMAGESPAAAAAMALREGKLFGVHVNDGYGPADDGIMAGSVSPIRLLELLAALKQGGFTGTIYFDTFPEREGAAEECAANIRVTKLLIERLDRLDWGALRAAQDAQDAVAACRITQDLLFGVDGG